MSDILTTTFLSEGDEGRRRVITSQESDQADTHEGTETCACVEMVFSCRLCVCVLCSKMTDRVGKAVIYKVSFKSAKTNKEINR